MAVIGHLAAIQVRGDIHLLTQPHLRQLAFLEIGVHPDIGQRHHRHQRRAGIDPLAHLHGALGNHPVHRRHDLHMRQRDGRAAQLRFCRQHVGIVRHVDAGDTGLGLGLGAARRIHRRFRRRHRVAGMTKFFSRDRSSQRRLAALVVALRLGQCNLRLGQLGGIRIGAGESAAHSARGARQIGFRRPHVHFGHRRIHLDQQLALLHGLGVVGIERGDGGSLAAGHRHDIAGDIGIIGGFMKAPGQQPPAAIQQRQHGAGDGEQEKSLASAFGF